jgi:2-methylcitrate dehydratase PrpD
VTDASLTANLARLIAASDPLRSPEAVELARRAIIDFLACTIAGSRDSGTQVVLATFLPFAGHGDAVLIGQGRTTDAFMAALVNGHAGHALDYDDVHPSVRGHPTTVVLPALLAIARETSASALELVSAYIVGVETMSRLGLALGSKHYENGFHATATLGTIGAAAACAHLLKLAPETIAVALGLAATQSAGLRLQFGFDAKPLHAGLAARAGLTAVKLAASGFNGSPDFLDGPIGFFAAYGAGAAHPERAVEAWGDPWQIVSPGLILKEFPCCTATHCAAEAILSLRSEHAIDPAKIKAVTATFPPGGDAALVVREPQTGVDGRFSVEYVIATGIIDGKLGIDAFSDHPVRADIAALARRVERQHDETAPRMSNDPATRFTVVDITFVDGSRLSRRVSVLRGAQDLAAKFLDAAGSDPAWAKIPHRVSTMESRADLLDLLDALAASATAANPIIMQSAS